MARLLPLWLALFSAGNLWRAVLALQQYVALPDAPVAHDPRLIAVTSVIWAVVFGVCAARSAIGRAFHPRVTIIAMLLYQAHLWLDVAVFGRSSAVFATLGFRALLSALAIAITVLLAWRAARVAALSDIEPSS